MGCDDFESSGRVPGADGSRVGAHPRTVRRDAAMRRVRAEFRHVGSGGFSLIELVIVIVIIAVISAIAIPRLSRGSSGANDSALQANWAALRKAIDLYAAEHGTTYPALSRATAQLTLYSDENGNTSTTPDATHVYGPYLRQIPAITTGPRAGQNGIALVDGTTVGWIYLQSKGEIRPNVPDVLPLDGEATEAVSLDPG